MKRYENNIIIFISDMKKKLKLKNLLWMDCKYLNIFNPNSIYIRYTCYGFLCVKLSSIFFKV